uniref:Uncharacterized protein n=1 Tax=Ascaris lumbricoides TaxID=6252 RepID=A0A0M3HT89_ASCLU
MRMISKAPPWKKFYAMYFTCSESILADTTDKFARKGEN